MKKMISREKILEIQKQPVREQELYNRFKESIAITIENLPRYAKLNPKSDYYSYLNSTNCPEEYLKIFCDRYVEETGTDFLIYPARRGYIHIRWRGEPGEQ